MELAYIRSSIIFIIVITAINGAKVNNSGIPEDILLPYYVRPVHYTIEIRHEIYQCGGYNIVCKETENEYGSFRFSGDIKTTIHILQSTRYIRLHQLDLTIMLDRQKTLTTDNGIIYGFNKSKHNDETNILEFSLSDILLPGLYTFNINFKGHLIENHEKSFYRNFGKGNRVM